MKVKMKSSTLLGIAAGVVIVPLALAMWKKYKPVNYAINAPKKSPPNNLFASYLGKAKPHHRKASANGVH